MDADELRDYTLAFIFYKYLSERQHMSDSPIPVRGDLASLGGFRSLFRLWHSFCTRFRARSPCRS
ncbi:MAG: hypothetical protein OXC91_15375 [Rhodobacteraceae bacterium]|nr:hypothetical protein [Paracoccaceae bacterium]